MPAIAPRRFEAGSPSVCLSRLHAPYQPCERISALETIFRIRRAGGVSPQVCPRHCTLCPIAQVIPRVCIFSQRSPCEGAAGKAANLCGLAVPNEGTLAMVDLSLPSSLPCLGLISWTLWKRRCCFQSSSENGHDDTDFVWGDALWRRRSWTQKTERLLGQNRGPHLPPSRRHVAAQTARAQGLQSHGPADEPRRSHPCRRARTPPRAHTRADDAAGRPGAGAARYHRIGLLRVEVDCRSGFDRQRRRPRLAVSQQLGL